LASALLNKPAAAILVSSVLRTVPNLDKLQRNRLIRHGYSANRIQISSSDLSTDCETALFL